jgi:hypothetical protein
MMTADSGKTLEYAASEVVRVEPLNESTDIWLLGYVSLAMAVMLRGGTVADLRAEFYARS